MAFGMADENQKVDGTIPLERVVYIAQPSLNRFIQKTL